MTYTDAVSILGVLTEGLHDLMAMVLLQAREYQLLPKYSLMCMCIRMHHWFQLQQNNAEQLSIA